jgi:hypothetical protein
VKKVVLQLWIGLEVEDENAQDITKARDFFWEVVASRPRVYTEEAAVELACQLDQSDQPVGEDWVWF